MRVSARLYWAVGLVLAVVVGVGLALWRAPNTVDLPVGTSPGERLPAPIEAPPILARAPADEAAPPGVSAEQWRALRIELAGRPAELRRLAGYFAYADSLQRFRAQRAAGNSAERQSLARALDRDLDEHLGQRELSAPEARSIKLAVLEVLLADPAEREAALARWEDGVRAALPKDTAGAARDAEFQRRQAEIVAAWSARPPAERDRRALERQLDALRQSSFDSPR